MNERNQQIARIRRMIPRGMRKDFDIVANGLLEMEAHVAQLEAERDKLKPVVEAAFNFMIERVLWDGDTNVVSDEDIESMGDEELVLYNAMQKYWGFPAALSEQEADHE